MPLPIFTVRPPLLEIHNIYAGYAPDNFAVQGVSIDLKLGEIVSIIGRNGAGKSTILKVLFGILAPHSGRILYNDYDITHIRPLHALKVGIAFVPQYRSIFPDMTVYENLEVGLYWYGDNRRTRSRIERILNYFGTLRDRRNHRARTLTGAEQRLLEIARAILWEPRLLLIDEPSLNLPPDMRDTVFETIARLNNEIGLTVLMAEQNTHLGISICHRGYLLHLGKVIYEGTHAELVENRTIIKSMLGE